MFALRRVYSQIATNATSLVNTSTTTITSDHTSKLGRPLLNNSAKVLRLTTRRFFASETLTDLTRLRNIGISAHIDSGKTTLTERILFYTGRIRDIHEVRGKDGVGAKMDSMELEREKGITIQSAATYCSWGDNRINIIDTPGHVDFTIEVERALRVLDSAILVLCGVSGVQSQTLTVDRQMKRYKIPRIAFINKLDRSGANPWKVIDQVREKLHLNVAAVQLSIGIENLLEGVVDLVRKKALFFDGNKGTEVVVSDVPEGLVQMVNEKRTELIHAIANVDDQLAELLVVEEREPTEDELKAAIRRATIANKFVPVFMGSAFKNKGVQPLLDGVVDYLPNPTEVTNEALNLDENEAKIVLSSDPKKPLVALAFKLEEGRFGQLTYMRVYQGTLARGAVIQNVSASKKIKVPRLVRMHSNEMEDIDSVGAGEICAMFGVDCSSGTTFTDPSVRYAMTSMHVPEPVMSLAVSTDSKKSDVNFSKALQKFTKEDPTFRVKLDPESGQTIISGMGELHLFIYTERMRREYGIAVQTGKPQVAFRETIKDRIEFSYTHKKQSGGQGQFAKVCGYLEPLPEDRLGENEFVNEVIGGAIPPEFMTACEKGFYETLEKGPTIGHPITGLRIVLNDGASHPVDSSDLAFRLCTSYALREAFAKAKPTVLEPIMLVEITAPIEFQGVIVGGLTKRKGVILSSESSADYITIQCHVPLNNMFGYSTDLRSLTQGKGEFSMEYAMHQPTTRELQEQLVGTFQKKKQEEIKK